MIFFGRHLPSLPAAAERWSGFLEVCLRLLAHPVADSQAQKAPAHTKCWYCLHMLQSVSESEGARSSYLGGCAVPSAHDCDGS